MAEVLYLVALGAGEVEDELLGLVFGFHVHGAVRMEKLVGEVAEHGGAAGRDASPGDLNDETGEEFLDVLAGRELVEFGEKIGGEVLGIVGGRRERESERAESF